MDRVLNDTKWNDKKWTGKLQEKANALTIDLAKKSFFGDDVMLHRNVSIAFRGNPPLLADARLAEMKSLVREKLTPNMEIHEFELLWSKCLTSLQKHVKNLRTIKATSATSNFSIINDEPSTSAA